MRSLFAALILCATASPAWAAYDPQHRLWNEVVSKHVKEGVVNYTALVSDVAKLEQYVEQVGETTEEAFGKWPREEQMAYLINAYNAFTLKIIVDFFPVESIQDIGAKVGGSLFNTKSKQWKVSEYEAKGKKVVFRAMGRAVSLDDIEHNELRPKYKDARVHFALVCGAISCPFLRSEAYVAARLDAQLDAQGKQFLADPFRNRYDEKKNVLSLSKIFDWFSADFKRKGTVLEFVKEYLPAGVASKVNAATEIEFLKYDWSLNSRAGRHTASN